MHRTKGLLSIALVVIMAATAFALVTSLSSLAMPAAVSDDAAGLPQAATSTPTEIDRTQAGSTDGIMWMGIVITAIILLPLLANRAMWQKQT